MNYNTLRAKDLIEAGINVDVAYFNLLDESGKIATADPVLTEMFKFITDKYNSIDFSEIEKSKGDYSIFKYKQLIDENVQILKNIYSASTEDGAKNYLETITSINLVIEYLIDNKRLISQLYKAGDGITQMMYTSLVAAIIYSVSALVANTIRFVTMEDEAEISVMYEEINNAAKNIHIKNIRKAPSMTSMFTKYLNNQLKDMKNPVKNEAVGAVALIIAGAVLAFFIVPRIIPFIRECIYGVYYTRIKVSQALDIQKALINTNIESLESSGRGNKKIIAKQKNAVNKLTKLSKFFAVKSDDAGAESKKRQSVENETLNIDRNSSIADSDAGSLML